MTEHHDITRDALPAAVGTLGAAKRGRVSLRFLFVLFLGWLVALGVVTAVVVASIMAVRAIG